MPRIKCAAVRWCYANESEANRIVTGTGHSYCYEALSAQDIYSNKRNLSVEEEGFLTDSEKFVDRHEAYKIAKAAGQLISENPSEILESYNVKY